MGLRFTTLAFSVRKHLPAVVFACVCALLPAPGAGAQVFDAAALGDARIDLGSGWLAHAGDDPAYAQPDFDDSHWTQFNAATGSLRNLFPNSQPPVVWYRLHLKLRPGQRNLALYEYMMSSAFVVYTDGIPLIQAGKVTPFVPYETHARLVAEIPANQLAASSMVIAVRVRLSSVDWASVYAGGLHDWKLSLGAGWSLQENAWLEIIGEKAVGWLEDCIFLCLVLGALLLYSAQRERTEYLWLALYGLAALVPVPLSIYSLFHPFPAYWHLIDVLCNLVAPYLIARMYLAFVDWIPGWRLNVYLVIACIANALEGFNYFEGSVTAATYTLLYVPYLLLESVVLPVILIRQFRRGNRDGGILLLPLLLYSLVDYAGLAGLALSQISAYRNPALSLLNLVWRIHVGPFFISFFSIANILADISLALIILLRTNRVSRQQAQLESEVAHARAVQQVMLPEHVEGIRGFEIESVYEPAQEVGGDFFQALPAGDGGLLIVVGDVAGKGLPAAMLVAMLVGAIRTTAAYSHDPVEMLGQLNERLIGRTGGGFSTALAAHIAADGTLTMANAGHPAPYLDGREIEMPGALPLGIDRDARYETVQLRLTPDSRLTFYSDGVIEAKNALGELFGFDRSKAFSTRPAADIAAAAKQFGQLDDITVVAILRTAAIALP